MPVPATTGQLRTRVQDMQIGDYIKININWNILWPNTFTLNGDGAELPLTGTTAPTGSFYGIKVDKGLIISDRVILNTVTWNTLNNQKIIQGLPSQSLPDLTIRSLTGGVAYVDKNGNKSLTDQGYGAWPTNNEWDKYIANFPSNLIQSRKTLDDVFHWNGIWTWTQDTPILQLSSSEKRILRGKDSQFGWGWSPSSSTEYQSYKFGFRPCFEYKE